MVYLLVRHIGTKRCCFSLPTLIEGIVYNPAASISTCVQGSAWSTREEASTAPRSGALCPESTLWRVRNRQRLSALPRPRPRLSKNIRRGINCVQRLTDLSDLLANSSLLYRLLRARVIAGGSRCLELQRQSYRYFAIRTFTVTAVQITGRDIGGGGKTPTRCYATVGDEWMKTLRPCFFPSDTARKLSQQNRRVEAICQN